MNLIINVFIHISLSNKSLTADANAVHRAHLTNNFDEQVWRKHIFLCQRIAIGFLLT